MEPTFSTYSYAAASAAVYENSSFFNYISKHILQNTDYYSLFPCDYSNLHYVW
jgi:hypothetical protein